MQNDRDKDAVRATLDLQARFAERLTIEPALAPDVRRVLLEGRDVGRILHRTEPNVADVGRGWVVEVWTGKRFERLPRDAMFGREEVEAAENHGLGEVALALAEGIAAPKGDRR